MLTLNHFHDVRFEMDTLAAQARNGGCRTETQRGLCIAKLEHLEAWWARTAQERDRIGYAPAAQPPKAKPRAKPRAIPKPGQRTMQSTIVQILRATGRPMPVEEIMAALVDAGMPAANRDSLTGSIRYLKGIVERVSFPKNKPGVYALVGAEAAREGEA